MDGAATPPPVVMGDSRMLSHAPVSTSFTPNTSETFRNVRPLQAAFTSTGLVSKRRRSALTDTKSAMDVTHGSDYGGSSANTSSVDMERASSLDALRTKPQFIVPPSRESLIHGRALREVVENAMADRSSSRKSQATMPDTPVKPSFSMGEAAVSAARSHRRGRSMGGPFPTRSPLFPTPPKAAHLQVPGTEAPRTRTQHVLGAGLPRTEGRRHFRSASERIPVASALSHLMEEPRATGDPNDVFETPESPLRSTHVEAEYNLPSLRREQPVRRTRGNYSHRTPFTLPPAPPLDELHDTPVSDASTSLPAAGMDSPNNCFASPVATFASAAPSQPVAQTPWMLGTPSREEDKLQVLHTGSLYGSDASPSLNADESSPKATPLTPTRKPPHLKWYEAANAHTPSHHYGGTETRKQKVARPRHSEPVEQLQTPPAMRFGDMAQSEPAHARHRFPSRLSQFEEQYVTETVLGQGEFSEVVKVREKATGQLSAVKRMKRAYVGPKDRLRRLEEVDVLCLLKQHQSTWPDPFFGANNVVELQSAWEEDAFLYLQTELCPLGSLAFVLSEYGRQVGPLDEARLWKILAELAAGVDYIHRSGVLHLDLKPANVLITEIGSLKITDFGMATRWPRCTAKEILAGAQLETRKFLPRDGESISDLSFTPPSSPLYTAPAPAPWGLPTPAAQGTFAFNAPQPAWGEALAPERPRRRGTRQHRKGSQVLSLEREGDREYIAPEVFFESKYGKPADLFALGLILLEAACSVEIPDNGEPWHKLRCDDFSDVRLDTLSPAMQKLIMALLSSQPYLRPTAADLMELPALATVRDIMRRGLRADELDQLPAFGHDSANGAPYPLPASKYYAPPAYGQDESRTVVRFRGAMIQEDEMAFMSEVLQAADRAEHPSPDTSASLMTDDAPESVESLPASLLPANMCMQEQTPHGMEIDKVAYLGDRVV